VKLTLESLPHHVYDDGDCWIWKASVGSHGYAQAYIPPVGHTLVRSYIFTHLLGRIKTPGTVLSLRCFNKRCVNPEHIFLSKPGAVQKRAYKAGLRNLAGEMIARRERRRAQGHKMMTREQVEFVRSQPKERSTTSIAAEIGFHHKSVQNVRAHRTHREVTNGATVFGWRP
jgi:hypothetical protein